MIINEYRKILLKNFSSMSLENKFPINIPKNAAMQENIDKYENSKVK